MPPYMVGSFMGKGGAEILAKKTAEEAEEKEKQNLLRKKVWKFSSRELKGNSKRVYFMNWKEWTHCIYKHTRKVIPAEC